MNPPLRAKDRALNGNGQLDGNYFQEALIRFPQIPSIPEKFQAPHPTNPKMETDTQHWLCPCTTSRKPQESPYFYRVPVPSSIDNSGDEKHPRKLMFFVIVYHLLFMAIIESITPSTFSFPNSLCRSWNDLHLDLIADRYLDGVGTPKYSLLLSMSEQVCALLKEHPQGFTRRAPMQRKLLKPIGLYSVLVGGTGTSKLPVVIYPMP